MKQILFFPVLLFLFTFTSKAADEYADGYFINKNNDTASCKILIPKVFGSFDPLSLFSKVTILDSTGKKKKYMPNDINGYGFIYNSKTYIYVSKEIDEDGKIMFVYPLNLGKKINEYCYYMYNTSSMDKGSMGDMDQIYILEDAITKETAAITKGGSVLNTYKQQLRRFFENDKPLMTLLEQDVKQFNDISKFVKDANNL
jgi:hypothetical protein